MAKDKTEYKIVKVNDDGKDLSSNSERSTINKLAEDGWEFHQVLGWNVNPGWGHPSSAGAAIKIASPTGDLGSRNNNLIWLVCLIMIHIFSRYHRMGAAFPHQLSQR